MNETLLSTVLQNEDAAYLAVEAAEDAVRAADSALRYADEEESAPLAPR